MIDQTIETDVQMMKRLFGNVKVLQITGEIGGGFNVYDKKTCEVFDVRFRRIDESNRWRPEVELETEYYLNSRGSNLNDTGRISRRRCYQPAESFALMINYYSGEKRFGLLCAANERYRIARFNAKDRRDKNRLN